MKENTRPSLDLLNEWLEMSRNFSGMLDVTKAWKTASGSYSQRDIIKLWNCTHNLSKEINALKYWGEKKEKSPALNLLTLWKREESLAPIDLLARWKCEEKSTPSDLLAFWKLKRNTTDLNILSAWSSEQCLESGNQFTQWKKSSIAPHKSAPIIREKLFLTNFSNEYFDSIYLHKNEELKFFPGQKPLLIRNKSSQLKHLKSGLSSQANLFLPLQNEEDFPGYNYYEIVRFHRRIEDRDTFIFLCDGIAQFRKNQMKKLQDFLSIRILERKLRIYFAINPRILHYKNRLLNRIIENIYQLEIGLKQNFEVDVQLCESHQVLRNENLLQSSYLFDFGFRNGAYDAEFYHICLASGADLINFPITKKLKGDIQLSEYHGLRLHIARKPGNY